MDILSLYLAMQIKNLKRVLWIGEHALVTKKGSSTRRAIFRDAKNVDVLVLDVYA